MLAVLLTAALVSPPQTPSVTTSIIVGDPCRAAAVHAASPPALKSRRLGELPPGILQLAVDKRVGGCSVTVLPTRDARGNHLMLPRGQDLGVGRAEQPSGGQRRPDRGR